MLASNRIALVTGANKGIGFEIGRQLARRGITVVNGARNEEHGHHACSRLQGEGLDVRFRRLDVTDAAHVRAAVDHVKDEFGRLDILINNAAILNDWHTSLLELSLEKLMQTMTTNVYGALLLSQACIPLMKERNYGRIINMTSRMGSLAEIGNLESAFREAHAPGYQLSKTGINAITVLLAKELRGTNILVNSACPGWVATDMGGAQAPLTVEQGADTPVWLATLPDGGPTGSLFHERKPYPW